MFIAKDLLQFKKLFVSKLKDMLSDDELGAFILVLANSRQDTFLKNELQADLQKTFVALKNNFFSGRLKATQDDVDVFKQLLDMDLDDIHVWHDKSVGDWEVAYNAMRQLRPARASSQRLNSIKQPFDEEKFHFNKAFLKPEILWQGEYRNKNLCVLYNKFPFSDYHLLIVVSPEESRSQLLTKKMHQYVFLLAEDADRSFPGFGIGFNSLAGGASVNHFHFQGFIRNQAFPVEKRSWHHNGGEAEYPLTVRCFSDAETSWLYINQLIEQDVAFNCLYRNNICYVVSRKYQGSIELPEWLTGAGWIDVAGAITVSDKETFSSIDGQSVTQALGNIRLN
jgi:diadenosine tetraphosphate (Ap4A) HIT family hydrolase